MGVSLSQTLSLTPGTTYNLTYFYDIWYIDKVYYNGLSEWSVKVNGAQVDDFSIPDSLTGGYWARSATFKATTAQEELEFFVYSDMEKVPFPEFDIGLDDVSVVAA